MLYLYAVMYCRVPVSFLRRYAEEMREEEKRKEEGKKNPLRNTQPAATAVIPMKLNTLEGAYVATSQYLLLPFVTKQVSMLLSSRSKIH